MALPGTVSLLVDCEWVRRDLRLPTTAAARLLPAFGALDHANLRLLAFGSRLQPQQRRRFGSSRCRLSSSPHQGSSSSVLLRLSTLLPFFLSGFITITIGSLPLGFSFSDQVSHAVGLLLHHHAFAFFPFLLTVSTTNPFGLPLDLTAPFSAPAPPPPGPFSSSFFSDDGKLSLLLL